MAHAKLGQLQGSQTVPFVGNAKKTGRQDSIKNTRCRSAPGPRACENSETEGAEEVIEELKLSDPTSPADSNNEQVSDSKKHAESKKTPPSCQSPTNGSTGSPKPKKTIFEGFRNTLRKSKGENCGNRSSEVFTNAHSMPDIVQESGERSNSGDSTSSLKQASMDLSQTEVELLPVSVRAGLNR